MALESGEDGETETSPSDEVAVDPVAAVTLPGVTPSREDVDLIIPHIPESRLTLVRDSAVLVGAATAALYLTSHVYGETYLRLFGVHNGFHAFGLENLALIDFGSVLGLTLFIRVVHSTCLGTKLGDLIGGIFGLLFVGSLNLLFRLDHVDQLGFSDFVPFGFAIFVSLLIAKTLYKKLPERIDRYERVLASDDGTRGDKPPHVRRYLAWRVWEVKAHTWVFCAYATVFIAIPSIAGIEGYVAAQRSGYVKVADGTLRVPVYWVGDRVVYLSKVPQCTVALGPAVPQELCELLSPYDCFVHTQIAGVEQSRHKCSESLRAIVNLQR